MSISKGLEFVQAFTATNNTHTTTASVTQVSGSAILVAVVGGASITTLNVPTDSKGNTYTAIAAQVNATTGSKNQWYYCENAIGGTAHTWTSTSTGVDIRTIFILEIKGGVLSGILDQATTGVEDLVSPYTSNVSGTTTQAAEMAVAFVSTDSVTGTETITWGNGFTQSTAAADANFATGGIGTQILGSTQTVTSSITSAGAGTTGAVSFVATFKEAAGAAANTERWDQAGGMGVRVAI